MRTNVCVRCRADLYFLHSQCHLACPSGFEPDVQLMQCNPQGERYSPSLMSTSILHSVHRNSFVTLHVLVLSPVTNACLLVHCEIGEWTDWSPCIWKKAQRAYRRGEEKRTREILQSPSVSGDPCPHVSEFRKCVIKKSPRLP